MGCPLMALAMLSPAAVPIRLYQRTTGAEYSPDRVFWSCAVLRRWGQATSQRRACLHRENGQISESPGTVQMARALVSAGRSATNHRMPSL